MVEINEHDWSIFLVGSPGDGSIMNHFRRKDFLAHFLTFHSIGSYREPLN